MIINRLNLFLSGSTLGYAALGALGTSEKYAVVQALGSADRQERNTLLHETGHIVLPCPASGTCIGVHHDDGDSEYSSPRCSPISYYTKYTYSVMYSPYVYFRFAFPFCVWSAKSFEFSDANEAVIDDLISVYL